MENADEKQNIDLAVLNNELQHINKTIATSTEINSREHKEILDRTATREEVKTQKELIDNHCMRIRSLEAVEPTVITRKDFDILIKSNQGDIGQQRIRIDNIEKKLIEFEPIKKTYDQIAALSIGFFIAVGIFVISVFYYLRDKIK